jgi:hypothetical protein
MIARRLDDGGFRRIVLASSRETADVWTSWLREYFSDAKASHDSGLAVSAAQGK